VPLLQKKLFRPGWIVYLTPAVLSVVVALKLGTMQGGPNLGPEFDFKDKLGHLLAFGLIQITHARAAEFIFEPRRSASLVWGAAVSATLVGAVLEIWQAFLPYRTAEFLDLVADGLGAALFAMLYIRLRQSPE
jgi:VanZ family protein